MSQQYSSPSRSEPVHGTTYNFVRESNPMNPSGSVYQPPASTTATTTTTTNAQTPAQPEGVAGQVAGLLACACCTGMIVLFCGAIVLAFSVLSLVIAIAEIVMGKKYMDQCPAEPDIPHFLYLAGLLGLVPTIFSIVSIVAATCISAEKKEKSKVVWLIDLILRGVAAIANFLLVIFLIYLIFITFSIYRKVQYVQPERTKTYCHKSLYRFTMFIAIYNIINAILICCGGSAAPEKPKKAPPNV